MSKTNLQNRIESGKPIILAEIAPPAAPDVAGLQEMARSFAGKVHALGVSDNRDDTRMCAMVAASIIRQGLRINLVFESAATRATAYSMAKRRMIVHWPPSRTGSNRPRLQLEVLARPVWRGTPGRGEVTPLGLQTH